MPPCRATTPSIVSVTSPAAPTSSIGEHRDPAWISLRGLGALDPELGIVRDDHALERAQLLARLEPQLLDKLAAGVLVDAQGVALAARAVERQHLQVAEALARRVAVCERGHLAQDLRRAAELQLGGEAFLERDEPQLLEPGDLALRKRLEREVGERRATPEAERFAQRGGAFRRLELPRCGERSLEPDGVDALLVGPQHVARWPHLDQLPAEHPPQARDAVLDVGVDGFRRALSPDLVDQPVGRDDLSRIQQEHREHGALLRPAEGERAAVRAYLEGAEEAKIHRVERTYSRVRPATRLLADCGSGRVQCRGQDPDEGRSNAHRQTGRQVRHQPR